MGDREGNNQKESRKERDREEQWRRKWLVPLTFEPWLHLYVKHAVFFAYKQLPSHYERRTKMILTRACKQHLSFFLANEDIKKWKLAQSWRICTNCGTWMKLYFFSCLKTVSGILIFSADLSSYRTCPVIKLPNGALPCLGLNTSSWYRPATTVNFYD